MLMDEAGLLIWILIASNVLLGAAVVARSCLSRRGVEVNHLLLFTFGFLFYWILPVAVGHARLFQTMPGMRLWYSLFDQVTASTWMLYLAFTAVCLSAFTLGSWVARRVFSRAGRRPHVLWFDRKLLRLYLIPGLLITAAIAFALRAYLFRGYVGIVYEQVVLRGSLISASLLLLVFALLNANALERDGKVSFGRIVCTPFFAAYFAAAILILGMGGRLYFVSSIFMLLVYRTVFFERIGYRALAGCIVLALLLSSAVGVVRLGAGINMGVLMMSVGAEPLFGSFSLIEFLRTSAMDVLNLPVLLLSDFLNLIPTVLFPAKQEYMLSPRDLGYAILTPFGGLNSFVSFMINFGMLGTVAVLFMLGVFLGLLKAHRHSTFPKILYIMVSGWLAFTFFRDPFSVSVVKAMFQFSLFVPVVLIISLHVISVAARAVRSRERTRLPGEIGA